MRESGEKPVGTGTDDTPAGGVLLIRPQASLRAGWHGYTGTYRGPTGRGWMFVVARKEHSTSHIHFCFVLLL